MTFFFLVKWFFFHVGGPNFFEFFSCMGYDDMLECLDAGMGMGMSGRMRWGGGRGVGIGCARVA